MLHETLHLEMDLHRQFAAEFGITNEELEATKPTPSNLAYTGYMLKAAHNGSFSRSRRLFTSMCLGLLGNW